MGDPMTGAHPTPTAPIFDCAEVTPDDDTDLTVWARALYIGVSGDLTITTAGGTEITLTNVPVGILPVRASRVHATGTAAAGIVAMW